MIFNNTILIVVATMMFIAEQTYAINCTNPKEVCVEPGGTRVFNGVSVTLPCWRYETTWECRETSDNNCKALRDQGCSQTGATCLKTFGGTCAVQEETYECKTTQNGVAKGIKIGEEFFCMSGDCASVNPKSNKNFGKTASYSAVLNAAAKDVKDQKTATPKIFAGKAIECSINVGDAKNCCKDSGWAKGFLGGCADDEVELAKARETGTAVEAGSGNNEYCHNRHLGVCTSYHRVYCVFPSKIAKIVQAEGRRNQLGIHFGVVGEDDAHPDCRGITPEELSKLNFDKMDFRSFYNDMLRNAEPELSKIKNKEQGLNKPLNETPDYNKKRN